MSEKDLKATSITFQIPDWPDVPAKVCSICTYEFLPNDYVIEKVVWNESGQFDLWETEYVHIHCVNIKMVANT